MAVMLKDIAEKAGVSPTTVSLVLNPRSKHRISEKTQQRVLEIAQELGYQPEEKKVSEPQEIEGLVRDIPLSIGLVISNITNPFFTELARVIEDVASQYGYNIILCNTQRSLERELEILEILSRRKVNGLIIAPANTEQSNIQKILQQGIPVVFVDRCVEHVEASAVLIDNVKGAHMAIEYLLGLGHKRIGVVAGPQSAAVGRERLHGYVKALEEWHIPVDETLIQTGDFTIEAGKAAMKALLYAPSPPSAVFSSAGLITAGILQEIREQQIKIPDELSLISFDDHIWIQLMEPPLTVVSQPIADIGKEATQLIIQLIQGWRKKKPQKIVLEPELIIRKSCARYPKN